MVVLAVGVILGVTLLLALATVPNTSDGMSYHLPRVMHWLDQGNLTPYYTSIDRQLWQPPFAEFLVALGYETAGRREWLVKLPEWLAFAGMVVAAMEIARRSGAGRRTRWFAGLIAATLPPAILQASSTQNDVLATFWLMIVAWLALGRRASPGPADTRQVILFGAATALAIGTKGTALFLAAPWAVLFVLRDARAGGWRPAIIHALAVLAIVVALNGRHWSDTAAIFGNLLGPASVHQLLRPESMAPSVLLANLVANLSLHLGTLSAQFNLGLQNAVTALDGLLGLSGAILYPYFGGFGVAALSTHEDIAGAPLHVLLGGAALVAAVVGWRRLGGAARSGIVAVAASWLLFAAAVRWQPYNARLHLPMLAVMAPFLALWIDGRGRLVRTVVTILLVAGAVPALFGNANRPLVAALVLPEPGRRGGVLGQPREAAYFNARPALESSYRALAARILEIGCKRVGLVAGYDSWEYPLWALTRSGDVRFDHLPSSGDHSDQCAAAVLEANLRFDTGRLVWTDSIVSLWRPNAPAPAGDPTPR